MLDWNFAEWKERLELLSYLVVALSALAGALQYILASEKERRDREYGTYNALDEKYFEFTKISLEYPRLDLFEAPLDPPPTLTIQEKQQQLAGYSLLIQIFERAYLMYAGHSDASRQSQWKGWEVFIEHYAKRQSFRDAWKVLGHDWDASYQAYMKGLLLRIPSAPQPQTIGHSVDRPVPGV